VLWNVDCHFLIQELMTSSRPYLIRALYEWIIDNEMTPHFLVDAEADGVNVPPQHVHEGRIVLNVNPSAVQELLLGNVWITFGARFGGAPYSLEFPVTAVMAIYARESGQGMAFEDESDGDADPDGPDGPSGRIRGQQGTARNGKNRKGDSAKKPRPGLRIVK
jgi:stringent starvation protein B